MLHRVCRRYTAFGTWIAFVGFRIVCMNYTHPNYPSVVIQQARAVHYPQEEDKLQCFTCKSSCRRDKAATLLHMASHHINAGFE